ncbi:MAG: hypothetical protein U0836_01605 [Pirellulales bacterium]
MNRSCCPWVWGVFIFLAAQPLAAQPRQASFDAAPPKVGEAAGLAFRYRVSQPGDRAEHQHQNRLELATTIQQAGQIASQRSESILRRQRYHVALLEPSEGESARAKIVFHGAQEERKTADAAQAEATSMPTDGKTYLVCRIDGNLAVFDAAGEPAPPDETQLVERTARSLGQRNPMGHFLNGHKVSLNQTLKLPEELSRELWDFGDELGVADHCELTLREVVARPAGPCGRFEIVVTAEKGRGQLDLQGYLLIDAASCRIFESELQGTFRSQMERGPTGFQFTLERAGKIQVSTRAQPADKVASARLQ